MPCVLIVDAPSQQAVADRVAVVTTGLPSLAVTRHHTCHDQQQFGRQLAVRPSGHVGSSAVHLRCLSIRVRVAVAHAHHIGQRSVAWHAQSFIHGRLDAQFW